MVIFRLSQIVGSIIATTKTHFWWWNPYLWWLKSPFLSVQFELRTFQTQVRCAQNFAPCQPPIPGLGRCSLRQRGTSGESRETSGKQWRFNHEHLGIGIYNSYYIYIYFKYMYMYIPITIQKWWFNHEDIGFNYQQFWFFNETSVCNWRNISKSEIKCELTFRNAIHDLIIWKTCCLTEFNHQTLWFNHQQCWFNHQ